MKKNIFLIILILSTLLSCQDDDDTTKPIVLASLGNHPISSLIIDNSNTLWIGTDTGLFKSVTTGYQLISIKNDAPVTSLGFDEISNTLWVGTLHGLTKISLKGSEANADTIALEKLSNDTINSVYVDSASVNWFGTENGITRNSSAKWQKEMFKKNSTGTITKAPYEEIGVNSISSANGEYFFATNGASVFRSSGWTESSDAFTGATQWVYPYNGSALTDTMYVVFIDSKAQKWMGGQEGLQVHSGNDPKSGNIAFYDELVNPFVHCIAEAPDGKIWAGTENGISVYDGNSWTPLAVNLPDNFVTAIVFEETGKAWIGTKKGLVGLN